LGLGITVLFYLLVRDRNPAQTETVEQNSKVRWRDLLTVLKNKKNWWLTLYSGLAFSPIAVFGGLWGNPFLEEAYHLSGTHAASLTSLAFMGLAIGGPLFGFISDRLGNRLLMMAMGTGLSLISILVAIYLPVPIIVLGVALFLFGLGTGSFMLGFAMGRDLNHVALAATMIALINTGDAIFGAFTEPLVGKVLDMFWQGKVVNGVHYFPVHDYHLALSVLPAYLAAALVSLCFLRRR